MSGTSLRSLLRLSAAVAAGGKEDRVEAMREASRSVSAVEIEEALLQAYLFLGFPAALTALSEWRDLTGAAPVAVDAEDPAGWTGRGERVCRTVYGKAYEKLRGNLRRVHPAMDDWMIREGYGKVLGRRGLDLTTRELCIVSILAATGWEPQLHSHLRGALHAGNAPRAVEEALEAGLAWSREPDWTEDARALWRRVRDRGA